MSLVWEKLYRYLCDMSRNWYSLGMSNITQMKSVAADSLQVRRAGWLHHELKADRWSLRLLQDRTGIAKSTLGSKLSGASPILTADIEVFADVLGRDPVKLFAQYLAAGSNSPDVGPTGIEPMTSTVEYGRLADILPFERKEKVA